MLRIFFRLPVMFMAPDGGGDGSGGGAGDGKTTPPPAPPEKKSYTQEELDVMFADRAKRASEKATADLLTELGLKNKTELADYVKKQKQSESDQLSEVEKLKKQNLDLETEKNKIAEEAKVSRIRSAVETAAAKLNFHKPEDAYALADTQEIKIGDDGKITGVDESLKALVKDRPYLVDTGKQKPPNTNSGSGGDGTTSVADIVTKKRAEYPAL
ncbi:MAG: hypothetical protein P4L50_03320 [Anaerolineaceae bacterium]|nr:hypothetical protein [Anaerolineaceae bacterium]